MRRIALLSVHADPLAPVGLGKSGGMNVYIREFAMEASRQGVEVDIYTRRISAEQTKVGVSIGSGIRVIRLKAGSYSQLSPDEHFPHLSEFVAHVLKFTTLHNIQYDLIFSHYWLSGWVAQKLREVWNIPFVQMFHTLGQMKKRILTHEMIMPDQRISIEMQLVGWADRIIAASPAEYQQLLWLYRADRRKIEIISPGVRVTLFKPIPMAEAKASLGIPNECQHLVFVGRIEPLKGVDLILHAIASLNNSHPEITQNLYLSIIGGDVESKRDRELERLRSLTNELGIGHLVNFLGAKDQSELQFYYSASVAVLMPSDYESFGMVALEGMASGTPVIASEVGGLAFLVKDNKTGFLIPARDAEAIAGRIIRLISDPALRDAMGANAERLAHHYSWSRVVKNLLEIFDDTVSSSKSQRI